MKFEIPFDQLVIFATNLDPKTLVDEAFLRRIRYKIRIDHPTEAEFREIFERVCRMNAISFRHDIFDYLIEHWYRRHNIEFNACHPRDLIDHVIDLARFFDETPELHRDTIDHACENYFVDV